MSENNNNNPQNSAKNDVVDKSGDGQQIVEDVCVKKTVKKNEAAFNTGSSPRFRLLDAGGEVQDQFVYGGIF